MNTLVILCSVLIASLISIRIFNRIRRLLYVKNFNSYIAILEFHMEKAYEMIYKDRLMVFSLEAIKIDDNQFDKYAKEFGVLVLAFIGPMIEKELINIYGTKKTLLVNIIEFFNTKYESDEIRGTAVENLMDQDQI